MAVAAISSPAKIWTQSLTERFKGVETFGGAPALTSLRGQG